MDIYKAFKKYKLQIKGDQIYDPIREKFVHLTPEEKVRQQDQFEKIEALPHYQEMLTA